MNNWRRVIANPTATDRQKGTANAYICATIYDVATMNLGQFLYDKTIATAFGPANDACRYYGEAFSTAILLAHNAQNVRKQTEVRYPDWWRAVDARERSYRAEQSAEWDRQSDQPERYVCATAGCIITAGAGKHLRRCA